VISFPSLRKNVSGKEKNLFIIDDRPKRGGNGPTAHVREEKGPRHQPKRKKKPLLSSQANRLQRYFLQDVQSGASTSNKAGEIDCPGAVGKGRQPAGSSKSY